MRVRGSPSGMIFSNSATILAAVNLLLNELRDYLFLRNQIDHRVVRDFDARLAQSIGQGRNAIHHDEWRAHDGGFDRCRAAGDDSGAGVIKGGQRFGDEVNTP